MVRSTLAEQSPDDRHTPSTGLSGSSRRPNQFYMYMLGNSLAFPLSAAPIDKLAGIACTTKRIALAVAGKIASRANIAPNLMRSAN